MLNTFAGKVTYKKYKFHGTSLKHRTT